MFLCGKNNYSITVELRLIIYYINKMEKFYYCFLVVLVFNKTCAQDSTYVKTYPDHVQIKTGLSYNALNLTLNPRLKGVTDFFKPILYRPSVRSGMGLDVQFKGISIGWSFGIPQNKLLNKSQAESKYSDFQFHSLGKKIGYDFYHQDYQGYFIENLQRRLDGVALDSRPDLRVKNISTNVFYVFNGEKFSYSAAFSQDHKQLKNAGSIIVASSFGYFNVQGDTSFIPEDAQINFNSKANINTLTIYTFAVIPGYAYTYLIGKKGWHLSASASGFIGLQYNDGASTFADDTVYNYFFKGIGRACVGHHGDSWVYGVAAMTDIQGLNTRYVQYGTVNLGITASCSYKFKTKFMQGKKSFFGKKPAAKKDSSPLEQKLN